MRILKTLKNQSLIKKFKGHRDYKYIQGLLKLKYCYLAALTKKEYFGLLMNSSPEKPYPKISALPTVRESIKQFLKTTSHLKNKHSDRGISGVTVAKCIKKFKTGGNNLRYGFIADNKYSKKGKYYIGDAMHRLVAYGIWKKLKIKDYEVQAIYCTNRKLLTA